VTSSWPRFVTDQKGQKLQQRLWDETRVVLEGYSPEVADVYAELDKIGKTAEK
jgi:hypothetical protein